jgi:hypothetical protein
MFAVHSFLCLGILLMTTIVRSMERHYFPGTTPSNTLQSITGTIQLQPNLAPQKNLLLNHHKRTFTSLLSSCARSTGNILSKNSPYFFHLLFAQPVAAMSREEMIADIAIVTMLSVSVIVVGILCVRECRDLIYCCRASDNFDDVQMTTAKEDGKENYTTFNPPSMVAIPMNYDADSSE